MRGAFLRLKVTLSAAKVKTMTMTLIKGNYKNGKPCSFQLSSSVFM